MAETTKRLSLKLKKKRITLWAQEEVFSEGEVIIFKLNLLCIINRYKQMLRTIQLIFPPQIPCLSTRPLLEHLLET